MPETESHGRLFVVVQFECGACHKREGIEVSLEHETCRYGDTGGLLLNRNRANLHGWEIKHHSEPVESRAGMYDIWTAVTCPECVAKREAQVKPDPTVIVCTDCGAKTTMGTGKGWMMWSIDSTRIGGDVRSIIRCPKCYAEKGDRP
jgi:hypothetical protein